MKYFFRGVTDQMPLTAFSFTHIMLLGLFALVLYLLARGTNNLRDSLKAKKLSHLMAVVLLIDQVVLYAWQFGSGYFNLEQSLPLFHCRIAVWLLIFGVMFKRDRLLKVGMYWGLIGALIANLVPDLYPFKFPHYTNFQFFICHMTMGWLIIHLLFNQKIKVSRDDTRHVLLITNLYNTLLFAFNLVMQVHYPEANYGYVTDFPSIVPFHFPLLLHFLLVSLLFNLTIFAVGLVFEQISLKVSEREPLTA